MFDFLADDDTIDAPRFRVALRVRGDTLDPDFLTQQLGLAPTFSARKGDEGADGARAPGDDTGIWTYRLPLAEETEMGSVIEQLLALFPGDATLWEELTSTYTTDVCCAVHLQGDHQRTALDPAVLAALGRRGLALRIELHAPGTDGGDDDDA